MGFMSMLQMAKGGHPQPEPPRVEQGRGECLPNAKPMERHSGAAPTAARRPGQVKPMTRKPDSNQQNKPIPSQTTSNPAPRPVSKLTTVHTAAKPLKAVTNLTAKSSSRMAATGKHLLPPQQPEPVGGVSKRLSFKAAMKKAASIDKTKLEISLKTRVPRKQLPSPRSRREEPRQLPKTSPPAKHSTAKPVSTAKPTVISASGRLRAAPAPAAQPNSALMAKYAQKKQQKLSRGINIDVDEELDGFVVDDDEEEEPRQEIWSMFNSQLRREYYDSDSDSDMEANGADILHEERRSALQARREDAEEERKLEELALRKQRRQK